MRRSKLVLICLATLFFSSKLSAQNYKVGDYYSKDGVQGIVFQTDGKHGKIVSLDEYLGEWSTVLEDVITDDEKDGRKNMKKVKQVNSWEKKFPVFAWCESKNVTKKHKWYLPAVKELDNLREAISKVNPSLKLHGKSMDSSFVYWSSSTCMEYMEDAWCLLLADGIIRNVPKCLISIPIKKIMHIMCAARCIMEF
jgi:hypothetical protein